MHGKQKTFLTDNEQYQLKIGSVNYRLFRCEREQCRSEFKGGKVNNNWKMCPKCQLITCHLTKTVKSIRPTEDKDGQNIIIHTCVKCRHKTEKKLVIPSCSRRRYNNSSSVGSGSSFSSRSSGGGLSSGGFRGGGSSGGGGSRGRF